MKYLIAPNRYDKSGKKWMVVNLSTNTITTTDKVHGRAARIRKTKSGEITADLGCKVVCEIAELLPTPRNKAYLKWPRLEFSFGLLWIAAGNAPDKEVKCLQLIVLDKDGLAYGKEA